VNATGGVKGDASSYWTQLPITGVSHAQVVHLMHCMFYNTKINR
jgi:hypothetical protein